MAKGTPASEKNKKDIGSWLALLKLLAFSVKKVFMSSPGLFVVITIITLINTLSSFVLMYCGRELINALSYALINHWSFHEALEPVGFWILVSTAISLGLILLNFASSLIGETQQLRFNQYINTEMAQKVASLDISYFDNDRYYDHIEQANNGKSQLGVLYTRSLNFIINTISLIISTTVTILSTNAWIPVVIVLFALPPLFTRSRYLRRQFEYGLRTQNIMRRVSYLAGVAMGKQTAQEVRFYDMSDMVVDKYKQHWNTYISGKRKLTVRLGFADSMCNMLPTIGIGISMYMVLLGIFQGRNAIGDFTYLLGMTSTLKGSFINLIDNIARLGETSYTIEKYDSFMKLKAFVPDSGTRKLKKLETIEFRDVMFTYPLTEQPVLNHLSLRIQGHEKIAMVGLNGAGKSTIVKLLLRFYDVDEGQILINGLDIREYTLDSLRRVFSTVFQDYITYSLSVRDNVAMSDYKNREDDARIREALTLAELDHGILERIDSLDVDISRDFSDDGLELSGGQKQKLAIARGAFRKADMVILDEPTASLDPVAEYEILRQFERLYSGRGLLMISHRLSNTTLMDRILVIEDGMVLEDGSHAELMERNGRYAYLFNLQASNFAEEAAGVTI